MADIAVFRADITRRKALELNPYIQQDEIDGILRDLVAEETTGLPGMAELEGALGADAPGDGA